MFEYLLKAYLVPHENRHLHRHRQVSLVFRLIGTPVSLEL